MCDMSGPYFPANPATSYPAGPVHDQYNGDAHHHNMHENGRPHHPSQYQAMGGYGQPMSYRPYPFDRIPDPSQMRGLDGTNAHHESSPYSSYTAPPHQPPPAQALNQPQYDSCSSRPSLTPPHDQQYSSCKMQSNLHHTDISPPATMVNGSPPPHQVTHPSMYGAVGSPGQSNAASAASSPLYPWMRSQFGKLYILISAVTVTCVCFLRD